MQVKNNVGLGSYCLRFLFTFETDDTTFQ